MGAPYALSSDLVSAWPAKSLEVAQYIDGQVPLLAMTQNAQTGTTYTFVAADFTKLVTLSNASPVAVTLPLESSVPWPTGTQLRLLNQGAGVVTVAGAVGVTINGTPLTLAQYKGAILTKTGTNTWTFLPFSGGSAPAVISSTTGSPTITTDGTATIYKFTGDGTLVVGTAGIATLLLVGPGGGGGGGGNGAGGGGGAVVPLTASLDATTYTIKVGAGAAAGDPGDIGTISRIALINAIGGGGGGGNAVGLRIGSIGSSTGGASGPNVAQAARYGDLGFKGGDGLSNLSGGGGGATAVGTNAAGSTAGSGGAGASSSITGSAVTYGGGGGGGASGTTAGSGTDGGGNGSNSAAAGSPGAANRGGGGGGSGLTAGLGGPGGSGVVIVSVG